MIALGALTSDTSHRLIHIHRKGVSANASTANNTDSITALHSLVIRMNPLVWTTAIIVHGLVDWLRPRLREARNRLAWLMLAFVACAGWSCAQDASNEAVVRYPMCLQEIDHIVGLAGVVLDPGITAGRPLPDAVEAALLEHGLRSDDYETVFELNQHLILHSADGQSSRPGSADAVVELALLRGDEGDPNHWIVLYWRIRTPCEE